jgi:capsular polysaccharide biosynthesis protein
MIRLYTALMFVAILGMVAYAVFVVLQPQYVSHTSFIVTQKDHATRFTQMDRVVNDIVIIARESVYDNSVVKKYNVRVNIASAGDANVVLVDVYAKDPRVIKTVEKNVFEEMTKSIRIYYADDVVLMRTLHHDHTPQHTKFSRFFTYGIMVIVVSGIIAGVRVLYYYIDQVRDKRVRVTSLDGKKIFEKFHFNRVIKKHEENTQATVREDKEEEIVIDKNDRKIDQQSKEEIKKGKTITYAEAEDVRTVSVATIPGGLAATPGNLPVVDVGALGFMTTQSRINEGVIEKNEPTEDELKARLNDLLRGKL